MQLQKNQVSLHQPTSQKGFLRTMPLTNADIPAKKLELKLNAAIQGKTILLQNASSETGVLKAQAAGGAYGGFVVLGILAIAAVIFAILAVREIAERHSVKKRYSNWAEGVKAEKEQDWKRQIMEIDRQAGGS